MYGDQFSIRVITSINLYVLPYKYRYDLTFISVGRSFVFFSSEFFYLFSLKLFYMFLLQNFLFFLHKF